MSLTGVPRHQRFDRNQPCPICGGHSGLPKGRGQRCPGFLSSDGTFAHCWREELAGDLRRDQAGTFAHRLAGPCRCGQVHGDGTQAIGPLPRRERVAPLDDAARTEAAQRVWDRTHAGTNSIVSTYLAARGLSLVPASLRYAPRMKHGPSGQWPPAMVAAVLRWPAERPVAVHRTWLQEDGAGKALVEPARMALGPIAGGAVRCAPAGALLAIAEGIETALALQIASGAPAWAVLGAANMANLVLPPLPLAAEILIGADPDDVGVFAARRAAARWTKEGREVRIAVPPRGLDFNDLLRAA